MDHQYFCLCPPGYEGQNCDKDIDDCASGPCQYGTCHDKVDDFHCDCVFFFKGKMCNKLTSWAIAFIALASLAVLLTCCCCWWIMGICNRDEEKTKVKPMKEKIKPKPTERQPRYDRW
ncbi:protein crumbs homolog 2-like [Mytilus californianus]|uniref:protein crumbs homolog 2-like n=1 Tax=Mytilus californianus TaxID=6549 RepID=UPI00224781E6|nr:protein crumbs homolog 2-like [Mytilus californianus]